MASPFRTAFVGLGVMAVCIMMASLKGHHLLLAFAAASVVVAIRSWLMAHKPNSAKPVAPELPARHRSRTGEHRAPGRIYQFPTHALNVSDASGS